MDQEINLEKLQIQLIDNTSGVFCGKNLQVSWQSVSKYNMGSGIVGGDYNTLPHNMTCLNDSDIMDSNINLDKV